MTSFAGFDLPFIVLTYVLSGSALFLALQRFLRLPAGDAPRLFWLSLGAGPVLISWVVIVGMQLAPGWSTFAYVVLVEAAVLALGMLGWRARGDLKAVLASLCAGVRALRAWTALERATGVLLAGTLGVILLFALMLPITENDALQYVLVARMFYDYGTLAFYPIIQPDPATGFYAVSSHPLGFMGLYLWTFMAQGGTNDLSLIKLASPAFVIFSVLALAAISWGRPRLVSLTAGVLLLTTPVYFIQSGMLSIDSFRTYLLVAAAGWLLETAARGRQVAGLKWTAGLFCGFSMFSHSINLVLTVPLLGAGYFVIAGGPLRERLRALAAVTICATIVGGERILSNLLQFGMPVYDFLPVYDLPFMGYAEHVWGNAGMVNPREHFVNGVLRGWTDPRSFGITYWIVLLALVAWRLRWPAPGWAGPAEKMLLAALVCLHAFAAATVAGGSPAFVTNARYLMTVQPFIASLGAVFLVAIYERYRDRP